ncbi:acetolactate decarboxylase [Endozoicomonas ascidiicola]|uniref:acetolactate decarboxylase n=1 Tax=Endozoicomonas ascidiicola TaxID=1698521 RepID=UPI0008309A44|nr:acetolactate decarboxylase [Endozoicomonas ascidiicola]
MGKHYLSTLTHAALFALLSLFFLPTLAFAKHEPATSRVYQYSTLDALLKGQLEGRLTLSELAKNGDFGLGTFSGVDGEMVVVDGQFYRVDDHGVASLVAGDSKPPFAIVIPFRATQTFSVVEALTLNQLGRFIDQRIRDQDLIHAIRIDGRFKQLLVRSVPKQSKPFRPLADVLKTDEVRFEYKDVEGTLVGFRAPDSMSGINVAGYHFHFIDTGRSFGGHVLELITDSGIVKLNQASHLELQLPVENITH